MFGKKRLDYLAIPNCSGEWKKQRKKVAVKEIGNRMVEKVLILKGKDSEEDILYLGKIVKKGDRVGIDTFPLHYKEYKELIKKARRDKKFPRGVKIENVQTSQPPKLFIYGIFGWLEEKIKKRKLEYKNKRHEKFLEKIKSLIKKII